MMGNTYIGIYLTWVFIEFADYCNIFEMKLITKSIKRDFGMI